jgi:hypothetical protein
VVNAYFDHIAEVLMKQYLNIIKIPITLAIANVFPGNLLYSFLPASIGLSVYNLLRFANIFFAGWLITKNNAGGLWRAALAGPLLFFIDHVVLKGGYFIVAQILHPLSGDSNGFLAFGGVIVSYIMFIPLILFVGFLGGWFSRRKLLRQKNDPS